MKRGNNARTNYYNLLLDIVYFGIAYGDRALAVT